MLVPAIASEPADAGAAVARLFTALWPDPDWARSLSTRCGNGTGTARLVPVANIHLTLNFLGAVPRHRLAELMPALRVPWQPFELSFSRFEKWRHGLVVALPDANPPALLELHAALHKALGNLGLASDERDFRPHLTLARRRLHPLPTTTTAPLRWWVEGYVLAESRATPCGQYRIVQRYGTTRAAAAAG